MSIGQHAAIDFAAGRQRQAVLRRAITATGVFQRWPQARLTRWDRDTTGFADHEVMLVEELRHTARPADQPDPARMVVLDLAGFRV